MTVYAFSEDEREKFQEELAVKTARLVIEELAKKSKDSKADEWVDAEEAKRLLNIKSKSKLQNLRDNEEIIFSQHGRTILYSRQSILDFHRRNSRR